MVGILTMEDEILQDFIEEGLEILSDLEMSWMKLEVSNDEFKIAIIEKIFRGLHTIKGNSSFFGLDLIKDTTHALENVIELIKDPNIILTEKNYSSILDTIDYLTYLFNNAYCDNPNSNKSILESINKTFDSLSQQSIKHKIKPIADSQEYLSGLKNSSRKNLIETYTGLELEESIEQFCKEILKNKIEMLEVLKVPCADEDNEELKLALDCVKYGNVYRFLPFVVVHSKHSLESIRYTAFSTLIEIAPQEIAFLCTHALKDKSIRIVLLFLEAVKESKCPLLTLYVNRELVDTNINPNIDQALEILELL